MSCKEGVMKMKYKILFLMIFSCVLIACSRNLDIQDNVVESSINSIEIDEKLEKEILPEEVAKIYNKYKNNQELKEMEINIGEIQNLFDYEFSLQIGDSKCATVRIYIFDGKLSSYEMEWNEKNQNNNEIKKCIAGVIAANEDISFKLAESSMEKLVNSYDGYSQSNLVTLHNYRYFIEPPIYPPKLIMTSLENWNKAIDKSLYNELTSDFMKSPLNQGEHGFLIGKVIDEWQEVYYNVLEVEIENNRYLIFYNREKFLKCFEKGKKYIFYGDIAKCQVGYSGCLRIDYYEDVK